MKAPPATAEAGGCVRICSAAGAAGTIAKAPVAALTRPEDVAVMTLLLPLGPICKPLNVATPEAVSFVVAPPGSEPAPAVSATLTDTGAAFVATFSNSSRSSTATENGSPAAVDAGGSLRTARCVGSAGTMAKFADVADGRPDTVACSALFEPAMSTRTAPKVATPPDAVADTVPDAVPDTPDAVSTSTVDANDVATLPNWSNAVT